MEERLVIGHGISDGTIDQQDGTRGIKMEQLKTMLIDLEMYVDHYGVDAYQVYYIHLWQRSLIEVLNGA